MSHIFLSYARANGDFVYPLHEKLERFYDIWIDKRDMEGTTSFDALIQEKIKTAEAFLIILSPQSVASAYVQGELSIALQAGIPVIPYVYQDCDVPLPLRQIDWVHHVHDDNAWEKLLNRLSDLAPYSRWHPGIPLKPQQLGPGTTFSQLAEGQNGAITSLRVPKTNTPLTGLLVGISPYQATYLFGQSEDTTEFQPTVQLAFQMTGEFPDFGFAQDIAAHFITPQNPHFKLRLIVIANFKSPTSQRHYGLDANEPDEWRNALEQTGYALTHLYPDKHRMLQLFIKGPAIFLYELGVEHKGFYKVEAYHYERGGDHPGYYKVLG